MEKDKTKRSYGNDSSAETTVTDTIRVIKNAELEPLNSNDRWVRCATICRYLDISDDTVSRRSHPWQDDPIPYRFRYKEMPLGADTAPEKRYWWPDVQAFLRNPPPSQAARAVQRLRVKAAFHV